MPQAVTDTKQKVALVTGGSSGIGEATARKLAALGFKTYAAARRLDRMEHLKAEGVGVLSLDLTDEKSIAACIKTIENEVGGIDVLVNNAGYGALGSVEEMPMEEARHQVEVNLFGLIAITRLVIPHMRAQRSGRIINVSSIGGVGASPYIGWYHATKFGLEGISSSLRQELNPFGVDVSIIRPGAVATEWADIAAENLMRVSGNGPYALAIRRMYDMFRSGRLEKMAARPEDIADVIAHAVTSRCSRTVYTAPMMARIMLRIQKLVCSDKTRDALNRAFMNLPKTME